MTDHYAILGVGRQATTAEIANAYRQLLLRERQEKGGQVDFGAYSQAYRTLTNHAKRQEYDRFLDELSGKYVMKDPESPTEAEKCYLAGQTCMEQKNFQDAVDYLYRAVQLEPETSHFCSQLGLALGMFKDRLTEAERYCKKAISLDPDNPDFRFNLGFLYQRHNLVDAAQTAFDLANEAISSRQARLLRENEPLITPWGDQGQNLLDDLARLESMMEAVDGQAEPKDGAGISEAAAPSEPPVVPDDFMAGSDLLRQLNELESQVSKAELAGALSATADQADAPMEPFLDDDLLKELDLLEAQVRGVEEFHNGEAEKAALEAAPIAAVTAPTPVPVTEVRESRELAAEPSAPAGGVILGTALEPEEPAPSIPSPAGVEGAPSKEGPAVTAAAEGKTEEALHEAALETGGMPSSEAGEELAAVGEAVSEKAGFGREAGTGIVLTESLLRELSAAEPASPVPEDEPPAPAAEAAPPPQAEAIPAIPPQADAVQEPATGRDALTSYGPAAEPVPAQPDELVPATPTEVESITRSAAGREALAGAGPAEDDRQLPRGEAGDKIRMLEELEREMLGELEMVRKEKERLQASA